MQSFLFWELISVWSYSFGTRRFCGFTARAVLSCLHLLCLNKDTFVAALLSALLKPRMLSRIKNEVREMKTLTVIVFTTNHADLKMGAVSFMTPSVLSEKSKFWGSGEIVFATHEVRQVPT